MKILDNVYLVGSGQSGLSHPFDCNIYLIDGEGELALIDSGAGADVYPVLSNIKKDGFNPENITKIILTHHHADHSGGCKKIKEATSAEIYIHPNGVAFVEKGDEKEMGLNVAKSSGFYSPDYTYKPFKIDYTINDGDIISVGKVKLKAINIPGHSNDSTCFFMNEKYMNVLFTGDVVSYDGKIGLLNRSDSNLEDYRNYFTRIAVLSFDALLPGHGIFILKGGQQHVEKAALALKKLPPPPNFI